MPFLLRLELPDVPGSLGRVASAIGESGADIEAILIVEKTDRGTAIDDVLLELPPGKMPDSVLSACAMLEDVRVLWISRYAAGTNLFMDLELVEELTAHPAETHERMLRLLPETFRVDWAVRARQGIAGEVEILDHTGAAPEEVRWFDVDRASRVESWDENQVVCAVPLGSEIFLLGRRGGPEFLDSEVARVGHLVSLSNSIRHGGFGH
ncbi:amino acid-binding protein [Nocardioides jishulii]|uniref:Amino acid-binding protein n=1 Tax=Nocardioides jishulii TaxID=2575440 RepID=A0A4U2YS39_9ACTN|nr:amino acid-binding protein [Nocardioides jishulii]QCX28865.1 amino acid-binding protein [Nocardioides jishulii]TKI64238.1 amino acid-binding protein [Nocardioides jishulii]